MHRIVTVISELLTLLHTATADCLLQDGFVLLDLVLLVRLSSDSVQRGHIYQNKALTVRTNARSASWHAILDNKG